MSGLSLPGDARDSMVVVPRLVLPPGAQDQAVDLAAPAAPEPPRPNRATRRAMAKVARSKKYRQAQGRRRAR